MSGQSADGIDREGIGMLYAGGAGILIGSSASHFVGYGITPLLGSGTVAFGFGYEMYQRYLHADTEQEADNEVR